MDVAGQALGLGEGFQGRPLGPLPGDHQLQGPEIAPGDPGRLDRHLEALARA